MEVGLWCQFAPLWLRLSFEKRIPSSTLSDDVSETSVDFIESYVVVSTLFDAKLYKLSFSRFLNNATTGLKVLHGDPRQDT